MGDVIHYLKKCFLSTRYSLTYLVKDSRNGSDHRSESRRKEWFDRMTACHSSLIRKSHCDINVHIFRHFFKCVTNQTAVPWPYRWRVKCFAFPFIEISAIDTNCEMNTKLSLLHQHWQIRSTLENPDLWNSFFSKPQSNSNDIIRIFLEKNWYNQFSKSCFYFGWMSTLTRTFQCI